MPQQTHMGPAIMMQNPANGFMTSQGMAPGPQMMYPPGQQGHFMPQGGGPPVMPVNGYPSPGRGAPMMMSQGSQQGHQQPPMFGVNPGMSPGPQYGQPVYAQAPPNQSKSPNLRVVSDLSKEFLVQMRNPYPPNHFWHQPSTTDASVCTSATQQSSK